MTPNPFPLEIVEKVNSPELLAFLQQFGNDKYADAADINKILQALQFIYENLGGSAISDLTKFTVRPTIDISGTAVLVSDDGEWLINGVPYAQTEGASFSFSLNDEGNQRFVFIIAGTDGDYNTFEGEQSATNPASPTLPLNCLLVSIIFITDSTITEIPLSAIADLIDADEDNQLTIGPNGKLYINVAAGSVPDATESTKGKAQIATEAEALAGTNDTKFITSLKLKAVKDTIISYFSTSRIKTLLGQASSTVDGWLSSTDWNTFNNKQNAVSGKGLSTNDFTDVDKLKLDNLSNYTGFRTAQPTLAAVASAAGTGVAGDWAIITNPSGNAYFAIWDPDTSAWVEAGQSPTIPGTNLSYTVSGNTLTITSDTGNDVAIPLATASAAGLQSKEDKSKLDGIASGATANSSDSTLLNRSNHTGTQLASTISDFTAAVNALLGNTIKSIIADYTNSSGVTGTASETLISSYKINANTLSSLDFMNMTLRLLKTGTTAGYLITIRIGTTSTFSTSLTQIAQFGNTLSTGADVNFQRHFKIEGGSLKGSTFTSNILANQGVSVNSAESSTSFNVSVDNWIFISVKPQSSNSDVITQSIFKITN